MTQLLENTFAEVANLPELQQIKLLTTDEILTEV
jgi:hypothetical protein